MVKTDTQCIRFSEGEKMQSERYNDFQQFREKLTRALRLSDVNIGGEKTTPTITQTHIELCWGVYQNARHNKHGKLVCGLISDLRDAKKALGGTNALHDGSVLNILNKYNKDGESWSTLVNDCWILGGIHAQLPFQLVSNPSSQTFKAPNYVEGITNEKYMMRVTGRELIGLAHFGYQGCVNPNIDSKSRELGVKYELRCFDKAKASQASLASYLKIVRHYAQVMKKHGAMPLRKDICSVLNESRNFFG